MTVKKRKNRHSNLNQKTNVIPQTRKKNLLALTGKIKTIQRLLLNKKKPLKDEIKVFANPAHSINFFKNLHLGIQKELNKRRQDLTGSQNYFG